MNNNLKFIFVALSGAGCGSLVTWLILNKRYTDKINSEIDLIRGNIACKCRTESVNVSDKDMPSESEDASIMKSYSDKTIPYSAVSTEGRKAENARKVHANVEKPDVKPDTEVMYDPDEIEDDNDMFMEDEGAEPEGPEMRGTDIPYVIEPEDFEDESTPFSRVTLHYYPLDDTLTNDEGEVLDIQNSVGDCINEMGKYLPNVIHVRNEKYEIEYEIVDEKGSYRHAVLGFEDDE